MDGWGHPIVILSSKKSKKLKGRTGHLGLIKVKIKVISTVNKTSLPPMYSSSISLIRGFSSTCICLLPTQVLWRRYDGNPSSQGSCLNQLVYKSLHSTIKDAQGKLFLAANIRGRLGRLNTESGTPDCGR